jgi:hypothetical protein
VDNRVRTQALLALLGVSVPASSIQRTTTAIWVRYRLPLVGFFRSGAGWLCVVERDDAQAERRTFSTIDELSALLDELWPMDDDVAILAFLLGILAGPCVRPEPDPDPERSAES